MRIVTLSGIIYSNEPHHQQLKLIRKEGKENPAGELTGESVGLRPTQDDRRKRDNSVEPVGQRNQRKREEQGFDAYSQLDNRLVRGSSVAGVVTQLRVGKEVTRRDASTEEVNRELSEGGEMSSGTTRPVAGLIGSGRGTSAEKV